MRECHTKYTFPIQWNELTQMILLPLENIDGQCLTETTCKNRLKHPDARTSCTPRAHPNGRFEFILRVNLKSSSQDEDGAVAAVGIAPAASDSCSVVQVFGCKV